MRLCGLCRKAKDVEGQLEAEKTPKLFTRERLPQFLAAGAASIGGFSVGASLVWASLAVESMRERGDFDLSMDEESRVDTFFAIGALAACPLAAFCFTSLGRKLAMILFCLPFILGWFLLAFAPNLSVLLLGRFIAGVGGGGLTMVVPIYTSEISTPWGRGNLGTLFMVTLVGGTAATHGIDKVTNWRVLAGFNAVVPAIMIFCVLFIPESPYFCVGKGRIEEARKALKWLRRAKDNKEVEPELHKIIYFLELTNLRASGGKGFWETSVWKPTLLGVFLGMFCELQGIHLIYFVEHAARSTNSFMNPNSADISICVPIIIATFLVDRRFRRQMLVVAQIGMTIGLTILGTFYYFKEKNDGVSPSNLSWLTFLGMLIYLKFYLFGIGNLTRIVISEILPPHFKGPTATIIFMFYWAWALISIRFFSDVLFGLDYSGLFWLYAGLNAWGAIFIYFAVPETKGKSLEEIQERKK